MNSSRAVSLCGTAGNSSHDLHGYKYEITARLMSRMYVVTSDFLILPHSCAVHDIQFHPRASILATTTNNICYLWPIPSSFEGLRSVHPLNRPKPISFKLQYPHLENSENVIQSIRKVAWSPDGSLLAVGDVYGDIRMFDLTGASRKAFFVPFHSPVTVLCWSSSGKFLLGGYEDGGVHVWKVDEELLDVSIYHARKVISAAWQDDVTYATCDSDGYVLERRLEGLRNVRGAGSRVRAVLYETHMHRCQKNIQDGMGYFEVDDDLILCTRQNYSPEVAQCSPCLAETGNELPNPSCEECLSKLQSVLTGVSGIEKNVGWRGVRWSGCGEPIANASGGKDVIVMKQSHQSSEPAENTCASQNLVL